MALLLLPSKHWLASLVPLTVACAALVGPGRESGPGGDPRKPANHPSVRQQSHKAAVKEINNREALDPVKQPERTGDGGNDVADQADWQSVNGQLKATMKKLDQELTRRQSDIREMQNHIEKSLKKTDLKKIRSASRVIMQQQSGKSDFNEIKLIDHADSLLDNQETDLKRSLENAAKSIQQVKEQLRSYQEMLDELKKMAYRKNRQV